MRPIDADTLAEEIETLQIIVSGSPAKWDDAKQSVLRRIAEQPTIDVVEGVRCSDCKHWEDGYFGYCTKLHAAMDYSAFCAYGERREK